MSSIITQANGKLLIPNNPIIPFIEGDGIGCEISLACQKVVNAAVEKAYGGTRKIEWTEVLAGKKAFEQTGSYLPDETLDAFKKYFVGIKGPLETPVGGGIRSLNVALRQTLDLYVCLRPVRWFSGVPSPIKTPELVDMHIFRENTEDIYAGIEFMQDSAEAKQVYALLEHLGSSDKVRFPENTSYGIKPISKSGSERLIRSAINYAIERKLPFVTLVHKGNIMKFTEGMFKNEGYALAEREFPNETFTWNQYQLISKNSGKEEANKALKLAQEEGKVIVKDCIMDAFLQESLLHPAEHSVIATMNLNGDYASDQLAAMVGGIGISPGANINYLTGHAIFEATHGTAPNIVGTGKANPSSLLLSAVMMLEYMNWNEAAQNIIKSMERCFNNQLVTADLHSMMTNAKLLSTTEFSDAIINQMQAL
ncbi:MAG: NADP-dependent isocitrate dehydrogenase [Mangrovibacterium sp.]